MIKKLNEYFDKHPMINISFSMISLMILIDLSVIGPKNYYTIWIIAIILNSISMIGNGAVGIINLKKSS